MEIMRLDHLVLTVKSLEATRAFYEGLLGMRYEAFAAEDGGVRAALHYGRQKINLHQLGKEFEPKATLAACGTADLCFIVSGAIADWAERVRAAGVEIIVGPDFRTGAEGRILSIYMRDPDGNLIELSSYEDAAGAG